MKIFTALILFLSLIFANLNDEMVGVDFYFHIYRLPLSLLLVLVLGIGIFMGFLTVWWKFLMLKRENRQLKNHLRTAQEEVSNLRIVPLKDD